jgi:hypothetical protein
MATGSSKAVRHSMIADKRGGYGSSSKQVNKLTAPPRGPAPGAAKSGSKPSSQQ